MPAPKWGARRAILNDLSPAATFIAANYNLPFDVDAFAKAAKQLLKEVEDEIGWMYETLHTDGKTKGRIDYTVWSEVFTCPECAGEINFTAEALDAETKRVKEQLSLPALRRGAHQEPHGPSLRTTKLDSATGETIRDAEARAGAHHTTRVGKNRYEKLPNADDLASDREDRGHAAAAEVPMHRDPADAHDA